MFARLGFACYWRHRLEVSHRPRVHGPGKRRSGCLVCDGGANHPRTQGAYRRNHARVTALRAGTG